MDEEERKLVNAVSSHDHREQKRQEREEAEAQKDEAFASKEKRSQYFWLGLTLLGLIVIAIGIGYMMTHKPSTYTDRQVHWHALVEISVCGVRRDLPRADSSEIVHGESFKGTPLMHSHDDNTIHIEGLIQKKEDIALGKFFDTIGVPFDRDRFMEVKNGDPCEGKSGTWKMFVNDQPRTDFREYVPVATEDGNKQVIKLVFAPASDEKTS